MSIFATIKNCFFYLILVMFENIATISLIGFLIGFAFSIPIAGPFSIMLTANALKGNMRFCLRANTGASLVVFLYVFAGVYGLTRLFVHYYPYIPYILIAGSLFLFYAGCKITRTNITIGLIDKERIASRKNRKPNGFWTGFFINFFNPSLFAGWLTSSFIAISFIASLGYDTGGIDSMIQENLSEVNKIGQSDIKNLNETDFQIAEIGEKSNSIVNKIKGKEFPRWYPLLISLSYAFFLSLGSIIWFTFLTRMLVRYRKSIKLQFLNKIVNSMGYLLVIIGLVLLYSGVSGLL